MKMGTVIGAKSNVICLLYMYPDLKKLSRSQKLLQQQAQLLCRDLNKNRDLKQYIFDGWDGLHCGELLMPQL